MQSLVEDYDIILEIPDVEVWEIDSQNSKLIQSGLLHIIEFTGYECFIIQVNSFKYSLSKEIPILVNKDESGIISYVLPNIGGYYGIRLTKKVEVKILEILEIIFTQHASLYIKENVKTETNITPTGYTDTSVQFGDEKSPLINQVNNQNDAYYSYGMGINAPQAEASNKSNSTTEKITSALSLGGTFLKKGMIKVAEKMSEGIKSGGKYISEKITNREEKSVNDSTVQKLQNAKKATSAALTYTQVQVQSIINSTSAIVDKLGNKIENSDTVKKITQNPNYDKAKQIGKSTLNATATVVDGMIEALCILGRGVSSATTEIVTTKYGEKVGETTKIGLDCVGNVGLMAKAYKKEDLQKEGDQKEGDQKEDDQKEGIQKEDSQKEDDGKKVDPNKIDQNKN